MLVSILIRPITRHGAMRDRPACGVDRLRWSFPGARLGSRRHVNGVLLLCSWRSSSRACRGRSPIPALGPLDPIVHRTIRLLRERLRDCSGAVLLSAGLLCSTL